MLTVHDSSGFFSCQPQTMAQEITSLVSTITGCSEQRAATLVNFLSEGVVDAAVVTCLASATADRLVLAGLSHPEAQRMLAAGRYAAIIAAQPAPCRIDHPGAMADALIREIGSQSLENLAVVVLTSMNDVIATKVISVGSVDQCLASPRSIFKAVLDLGGCRFLLAHNHPSGCTNPSRSDLLMTTEINAACRLMAIPMLDHFVVTRDNYTSIRSAGTVTNWMGL